MQYEDDKPLPSCLILGFSVNDNSIHIVVGNDREYIYLITAYYPNPKQLEKIVDTAKKFMQEVLIVDYSKVA